MKKQLFIALILLGAGRTYTKDAGVVENIKEVQERLNYIGKNVEEKNIYPGFLSTWKEMVDGCMNYSIKNSTNYIGTEDKEIIQAARDIKYINAAIIPTYETVYGDSKRIKGYPNLKEYLLDEIDYKAQDLRKLFSTIDSKTHSTARRNNAKQALLKTITKLLHVLHQTKAALQGIK